MKTPLLCKLGIHLTGTSSNGCMYDVTRCDRCGRDVLFVWLDSDHRRPRLDCARKVMTMVGVGALVASLGLVFNQLLNGEITVNTRNTTVTTEQAADEARVRRVLVKIEAYRNLDVSSQLDQGLTGLSLTFTESTSLANWLARTINCKEETTD